MFPGVTSLMTAPDAYARPLDIPEGGDIGGDSLLSLLLFLLLSLDFLRSSSGGDARFAWAPIGGGGIEEKVFIPYG